MSKLLVGFVLGIVVSTVGFSGIAKIADNGVEKVKQVTVEQAKWNINGKKWRILWD